MENVRRYLRDSTVSVIVPVLNEEGSIEPLYRRIKESLKDYGQSEIIFIDDGSTDGSGHLLETLSGRDTTVKIFRFPSHRGQHKALEVGFREARGDIVATIDGDLQYDPCDIPALIGKLREGFDVVCGWRQGRRDAWYKKAGAAAGNFIQRAITGLPIHDMGCGMRAYKKDVIQNIRFNDRYEIGLLPCILAGRTSAITEIRVPHRTRTRGKSKYALAYIFGTARCYITFLLKKRTAPAATAEPAAARRISVVIPAHNARKNLAPCLESVCAASYGDFEVIVVDDHSDDGSAEIARTYPCRVIRLPRQRGPAFARDAGAREASGEIVAFLDSDCIAPKDWLAKINERFLPGIAGVGGRYDIPGDTPLIPRIFLTYWYIKDTLYAAPRDLVSLYGGNCAFRRSALRQRRKKPELTYCNKAIGSDDTVLCAEMTRYGRVVYDPGLAVVHDQRYGLPDILKKSFAYGSGGARTVGLCGARLFREPHHLWKTALYLFSVFLLVATCTLPWQQGLRSLYGVVLLAYLAAHAPLMVLVYLRSFRSFSVVFLPAAVFAVSLCNLAGHVKNAYDLLRGMLRSLSWHWACAVNILYPASVSRIFFFVTKACNARCYFCFNKEKNRAISDGKDLSLEEIRNITARMGFLPWLTLTGGEPFLRSDLYDICRLFYDTCGTRAITVATNGLLPERIERVAEDLLTDCPDLRLVVTVAVDDIAEKHDALRGVSGSYAMALSALERLNSLKERFQRITVDVNTILVKENTPRIENILDHFRNTLAYSRHYLNPLRRPPATSIDPDCISAEDYCVLLRKTGRKTMTGAPRLRQRFNQALLEYCSLKSLGEFRARRARDVCKAAKKFFVIGNSGDVFACELSGEKLGSLREEGYRFARIARSKRTRRVRSDIRRTKCYCQWPCAISSNVLLKISSYPKIIAKMLQASSYEK